MSHWAEGTLNSAGRGIRTRRAQCGDDGLARGHACMALAHTGMLAVTLWLKIAAERAAQLYLGCRCPGSVACGADWHVHAGMAQDRWRDAKSESRTVAVASHASASSSRSNKTRSACISLRTHRAPELRSERGVGSGLLVS